MAQIETWLKCDLKQPVTVKNASGTLFTNDKLGNKIGVEVFSDGVAVTVSGTVVGYCVLASGTVVTVAGSHTENKAYIVLPQSAYSVPGMINIIIKLDDGTQITTLGAMVATVFNTHEAEVVDPGQQQIADWTAQITNTLALISSTSVRYDTSQSLTTAQKNQAKTNIDAHVTAQQISGDDYKIIFP